MLVRSPCSCSSWDCLFVSLQFIEYMVVCLVTNLNLNLSRRWRFLVGQKKKKHARTWISFLVFLSSSMFYRDLELSFPLKLSCQLSPWFLCVSPFFYCSFSSSFLSFSSTFLILSLSLSFFVFFLFLSFEGKIDWKACNGTSSQLLSLTLVWWCRLASFPFSFFLSLFFLFFFFSSKKPLFHSFFLSLFLEALDWKAAGLYDALASTGCTQ